MAKPRSLYSGFMEQRISFITLAVDDVARSRAFYADGLGWKPMLENDEVLMRPVGQHLMPSLWSIEGFSAEVGHAPTTGIAPLTLAHNCRTEAEVDSVLELAASIGAETSPAIRREWGGYSGYFSDPDAFRWEIAMKSGPTGDYALP